MDGKDKTSKLGSLSYWGKRIGLFLAGLLLLWGGYRGCRYIVPAAPEVYKIAIDTTWYPLLLYGREHSMTAFASDLLFQIARNQKIKVEIIRVGPKRTLELLDDGYVDGIFSSLTPDKETEQKYYFSEPFYRFGAVLVMRKEYDFKSLQALPNKRIAVKRNSPILYHLSFDPTIVVVPFDSPLVVLDDLAHDRVDGVFIDQLLAYFYYGGLYRDQFKVVTKPLTDEGMRLVTLQENYTSDLIEMFNAGLKNMIEDGTYDRLLKQWELYNPEKPE